MGKVCMFHNTGADPLSLLQSAEEKNDELLKDMVVFFQQSSVSVGVNCQLDITQKHDRKASTEELPPSSWPIGLSRGHSFLLLIDVGRPFPLWVISSLGRRSQVVYQVSKYVTCKWKLREAPKILSAMLSQQQKINQNGKNREIKFTRIMFKSMISSAKKHFNF